MPLSENDQGYSVAENKKRASKKFLPDDLANPAGSKADYQPGGNGVAPQFSPFSDIKATHGNKGAGQPSQPSVGYRHAD